MPNDASKPTIKTDGVAEKPEFWVCSKCGKEERTPTGLEKTLVYRYEQHIGILRDELSAHEQKVRELVSAANRVNSRASGCQGLCHDERCLFRRLRAALKALEEEK